MIYVLASTLKLAFLLQGSFPVKRASRCECDLYQKHCFLVVVWGKTEILTFLRKDEGQMRRIIWGIRSSMPRACPHETETETLG